MGLTSNILKDFIELQDYIKADKTQAKCLAIGTIDFWADYKTIKECSINNISKQEYLEHIAIPPKSELFYASCKEMMARIFSHFGYSLYEELDINQRADIVFDLNKPITDNLKEKYDLIWDTGSVEHIMNVNQVFQNIVDMVKPGGKILHTQGIGDQTNFGYWTISPNFFIDFYTNNGFSIDSIQLVDRHNHRIPYTEITKKGSTIGELLPLRFSILYYLKTIRYDISSKMIKSLPCISRILNYCLKVPFIGSLVGLFFGTRPEKRPDWSIIVIAEKKKNLQRIVYPIQNIYRESSVLY